MALVPANEITRVREAVRRFATGFTPGQKAVTIAALVALVVGVGLLVSFTGRPTYAPLFTNLQPADAASITAKLTSDKVPYQLADGGSTIMVPAADVATERLSLAQAGLPASSTVGLSLLDKEGITSSSLTQQADYLRALQGELEQTIDAIHGVRSTQVEIALPANQTFSLNSTTPTGASVLVAMQPGQTLSTAQVQAIVHLVASSVPNLDAADVTVADDSGNLLAGPGVAPGPGGADNQTEAYDAAIQAKVQAYLASVVGQGNADVQVNATLDYDQVKTTTQSILPGPNGQQASFCTQTNTSSSSFTGAGSPPGGAAGAITVTPSGGNSTYTQSQSSQTCETNEQTQTVQQAPGTVKSQSVAVLVNSNAVPKGVSLAALQQGVAAAAGIDPARGDQLAFSAMAFSSAGAKQAAKAAAAAAAASRTQQLLSAARVGVLLLAVAVVLFLLWRSARRARAQDSGSTLLPPDVLAAMERLVRGEEATGQLPATTLAQVAATAEAADVNRFIDAQPEDVAAMLRSWLGERPAVTQGGTTR